MPAGVPEENRSALSQAPCAHQGDEAGQGLGRVGVIHDDGLAPGEKDLGFPRGLGGNAVALAHERVGDFRPSRGRGRSGKGENAPLDVFDDEPERSLAFIGADADEPRLQAREGEAGKEAALGSPEEDA